MNFSKAALSILLVSSSIVYAQSNTAAAAPLYKVVDGTKVDSETMKGFRTWRAAACDRCHGANQQGMVWLTPPGRKPGSTIACSSWAMCR